MKIVIGSKNPAKVDAVREILQDYPHLKDAEVVGIEVASGVPDQPRSIEEITGGATNRAKGAFADCDYSVGIESGVMKIPNTKSGYLEACAAVIYDGENYHLGLSSGFEFPDKEIMRTVIEDNLTVAEAINKAGLTNDPHIGSQIGAIGILTKGRLDRKAYTKEALRTALIHIDPLS
jgi:inosine/xanthosine triphosphatase